MLAMAHTELLTNTIPDALHNLRLDQALAQLFPEYSRTRLQEWIRSGQVLLDGHIPKAREKVYAGQTVALQVTLKEETIWHPQARPLDILYEDEHIIVINKPAGWVVHPGAGNPDQTLVNALLHYAPELSQLPRAGVVHRLDKDTSGIMVIARTLTAHTRLVKQIQDREVQRQYLGITHGALTAGGSINAPIGRHPRQRTEMAVIPEGKPAVTHYRVLERFAQNTYVQLTLETGRTHQIRVHLSHIGYPLVGDPKYGGRLKLPPQSTPELKEALRNFKRQALHAQRLALTHPITSIALSWEAPVPDDLKHLLEALQADKIKPKI